MISSNIILDKIKIFEILLFLFLYTHNFLGNPLILILEISFFKLILQLKFLSNGKIFLFIYLIYIVIYFYF